MQIFFFKFSFPSPSRRPLYCFASLSNFETKLNRNFFRKSLESTFSLYCVFFSDETQLLGII